MSRSYKFRKDNWALKPQLRKNKYHHYQVEIPAWVIDNGAPWYCSYTSIEWVEVNSEEYFKLKRVFHNEKKDYLNQLSSENSQWRRNHIERPYRHQCKEQLQAWVKLHDKNLDWDITPLPHRPREEFYW